MTLGDYFASVLAAARQGHAWAWEAIYRDLAGSVLGYAINRASNDPEEVASETFLQVARNIHRFEGDEKAVSEGEEGIHQGAPRAAARAGPVAGSARGDC